MRYLLDTDISSYSVSAITCAELLYGLKRLRQFLKTVRVAPWDVEAAGFYAEIRHQLVKAGQPIGELDMMIAAHSLALAAVLVTNNTRHYERITAPLTLQNWSE